MKKPNSEKKQQKKKLKVILGGLTLKDLPGLSQEDAKKLIESAAVDEIAAAVLVARRKSIDQDLPQRCGKQSSACESFVADSLLNAECRHAGAETIAMLWTTTEMRSVCYAALQLVQRELRASANKKSDRALLALKELLATASHVCIEAHETWLERAADNVLAILPVKGVSSPRALAAKCAELADSKDLLISTKAAISCITKTPYAALRMLVRQTKLHDTKEPLQLLLRFLQQKAPRPRGMDVLILPPPDDEGDSINALVTAASVVPEIAIATKDEDTVEALISLANETASQELRRSLLFAAVTIAEAYPVSNFMSIKDEFDSSWLVVALRCTCKDDTRREALTSATIKALTSSDDRYLAGLLTSGLAHMLKDEHTNRARTSQILMQASLSSIADIPRQALAEAAALVAQPTTEDSSLTTRAGVTSSWTGMVGHALDRRDDNAKDMRLSAFALAHAFAPYCAEETANLLLWPRERRRRTLGNEASKERQATFAALRASWSELPVAPSLILLHDFSYAAQPPGTLQVFYNLEPGRTIQNKSREAESERRAGIVCLSAAVKASQKAPLIVNAVLAGFVARLGLSKHPDATELFSCWLGEKADALKCVPSLLNCDSAWDALRSLALATPLMRTSARDDTAIAAAATCAAKARPLVQSIIHDLSALLDNHEESSAREVTAAVAAAAIGLIGHVQCRVDQGTRDRAEYIAAKLGYVVEDNTFNTLKSGYESPSLTSSALRDLSVELRATIDRPDGGIVG